MARKRKSTAFGDQILESNRKARFEYQILEEYEAGIALTGSEVKSIREGHISLKEAYCQFKGNELFLYQSHVAEYVQAHGRNHSTVRPRKLLLHRRELNKLAKSIQDTGIAIIPLSMYIKGRHIKLKIALAKGKKLYDKRVSIKEREQAREVHRAIRDRG